jgi:hypothetical protein
VWSARPQTVLISRLRVQNRLRRLPKLAGSDARDTEGIARLSYPDLAEALQARMLADLKAGQFDHPPRNRPAPDECRRVKALEAHIATLEEAVAKAEALGEQRRQQAETAVKRADDLVAELVEITTELIEMSKRMAEQTTATDKLRAEFDEYRSRSQGWQHAKG